MCKMGYEKSILNLYWDCPNALYYTKWSLRNWSFLIVKGCKSFAILPCYVIIINYYISRAEVHAWLLSLSWLFWKSLHISSSFLLLRYPQNIFPLISLTFFSGLQPRYNLGWFHTAKIFHAVFTAVVKQRCVCCHIGISCVQLSVQPLFSVIYVIFPCCSIGWSFWWPFNQLILFIIQLGR